MNAATYNRTSYQDKEKISIDAQIEVNRAYCQQRGYRVWGDLVDHNVSGADLEAPDLLRGLELARQGTIDVLVARDASRFARDSFKLLLMVRQFAHFGVAVEFSMQQLDDSDEGVFLLQMLAAVYELERKGITKQLARGRRDSARRGNVLVAANPPLGYRVGEVDSRRTLIVQPDEAEVVRLIFDLYINGLDDRAHVGIDAIAKELSARRIPTLADKGIGIRATHKRRPRGHWAPASVARILGNFTYTGTWHYRAGGEVISVSVPAIIDEATFERAQQRRVEQRQMSLRNTKGDYLMRGRVFCKCGYKMGIVTSRIPKKSGGNYTYRYYRCGGTRPHFAVPCPYPHTYFRVEWVEGIVWDALKELLTDPERLEKNLRIYQADCSREREPLLAQLDHIEQELTTTKEKLELVIDTFLDGDYTREILAQRQTELQGDIDELTAQRDELLAQQTSAPAPLVVLESVLDCIPAISEATEGIEKEFEIKRWIVDKAQAGVVLCTENGQRQVTLTLSGIPIVEYDDSLKTWGPYQQGTQL